MYSVGSLKLMGTITLVHLAFLYRFNALFLLCCPDESDSADSESLLPRAFRLARPSLSFLFIAVERSDILLILLVNCVETS